MGILSCLTEGLPGLIAARASTALVSTALDSVFFVVTGAFNCTTTCFATFLDKGFICGATGAVFLPTGLAIAVGSALATTFDPVSFTTDFAAGFTTCLLAVFGAALALALILAFTLALALSLATGLAAAFFTLAAGGAALTAFLPVFLSAGLAGLAVTFAALLATLFITLVASFVATLFATLVTTFAVTLPAALLTAFTLFAATGRDLLGAGFATSFEAGLFAFLALAGAATEAFEVAGLTEVFAGFVIALAIKSQLKGYRAACAARALNPRVHFFTCYIYSHFGQNQAQSALTP